MSKLQETYYTYIKDGIKIYELRVNDEKRRKMKKNEKKRNKLDEKI
jgi:ASC-1-like (ASCH) protein